MIKFETVVKVLVFTLSVTTQVGNAQSTAQLPYQVNGDYKSKSEDLGCKEALKNKQHENYELCRQIVTGGSGNSCADLERDFTKAQADFLSACGNVPAAPGAREGDIGCSWTFVRCNACTGKPSETTSAIYKCESVDMGTRNSLLTNPIFGQLLKQQGLPGIDTQSIAARGKYSNCPDLAAADLDKLKKDLDDNRKELKKAAKEIPEMREKQNKAVAETNNKIDNLRKKMTEDTKAHRKELREAAKAKDAANKGITDQVFAIEDKITQMMDEKAKNDLAATDAAIKLKQAKLQIELNCHQSASAQVGKMQADILAGSKGNLSKSWLRGGLNSMMKLTGMSDRSYWKKNAEVLYKECLASKPTLDAKASANEAYQFALQQGGANERSLESKIQKARQQQTSLNGQCVDEMTGAPAAVESEACKVARNASQDAQAMAADFEATQNANNVSYQMLQKQGYDEFESFETQIAERQAEVDDESTRLFNMESLYTMRNQIADGMSSDKKDLADARVKFAQFSQAAAAVAATCPPTSKYFQAADKFLRSSNPNYQSKSEERTPASPATPSGGGNGNANN